MADHGALARSYDEVVARYLADYAADEVRELDWFRRQKTLGDAVRLAGMAERPFGKRFDHQRRIPARTLQAFTARLGERLPAITTAESFQDLHAIIADAAAPLPGIGDLTVYDTALRIGAKLGLEPNRIYLHTGTRAGAQSLGLGKRRQWIAIGELPEAFRQLSGRQAEDCLCIFRESLRVLAAV